MAHAEADVLVVDDDAVTRSLLRELLTSWGARVMVAASAAEARALFDAAPPLLLVSDITMPGESGYDLVR